MYKANKLSRNKTFNKVNKGKLRRMIEKRPPSRVGKKLNKDWILRGNIRTDNREILYELLYR